jgi:hypothetical protein
MMTTPAPIKVDVSKDEDGNLLMIVEQELTKEQKDTLYQAMRLFKGGDFSGPGFNVYLKGEDIVLERVAKGTADGEVSRIILAANKFSDVPPSAWVRE